MKLTRENFGSTRAHSFAHASVDFARARHTSHIHFHVKLLLSFDWGHMHHMDTTTKENVGRQSQLLPAGVYIGDSIDQGATCLGGL